LGHQNLLRFRFELAVFLGHLALEMPWIQIHKSVTTLL
jgi:hypothetical protein